MLRRARNASTAKKASRPWHGGNKGESSVESPFERESYINEAEVIAIGCTLGIRTKSLIGIE